MSFGGKSKGSEIGSIEQFLIGGFASMSAAVTTHPIDLIKVRLMLQTTSFSNPIDSLRHLIRNDGVFGLYKGLSASLLRQGTYSMTRFGVYGYFKDLLSNNDNNPSAFIKLASGVLAGSVGALVGNPADLTMVRMQADTRLPKDSRYGYKNVLDGITRIIKEEGVLSLWQASELTIVRAMLVTAAQLGAYDQFKQILVSDWKLMNNGILAHFVSSFCAGFAAAVVTNPVDLLKMRMMNQSKNNPIYRGPMDCLKKLIREEGFMALFKGFIPNFMRLGPQTIMTFIFYEQYVNFYRRVYQKF